MNTLGIGLGALAGDGDLAAGDRLPCFLEDVNDVHRRAGAHRQQHQLHGPGPQVAPADLGRAVHHHGVAEIGGRNLGPSMGADAAVRWAPARARTSFHLKSTAADRRLRVRRNDNTDGSIDSWAWAPVRRSRPRRGGRPGRDRRAQPGSGPMELMLLSVGSCSAMNISISAGPSTTMAWPLPVSARKAAFSTHLMRACIFSSGSLRVCYFPVELRSCKGGRQSFGRRKESSKGG